MKNQSSENYLDQLLNSINDDDLGLDISPMKEEPQMDAFERELFGEPETKEMLTAKDEEDFLREFEAELLRDDIPNFSDDFMRDMEPDSSMDGTVDASIDDMISHMDAFEDVPVAEEEPPVDEDADFSGEIPGEPEVLTEEEEEAARADENLEQAVDAFDDAMGENLSELPLGADGEVDLSGLGDNDLMDILAGEDGLSDLGNMLSADSEGTSLDGTDEIGDFAEAELKAQQMESDPDEDIEEGDGKKKKRRKKKAKANGEGKAAGGFLAKLTAMLFGEEEPDGDADLISLSEPDETDFSQLSDENAQILKELEAAGEGDTQEKKDKKGKKEKKEKAPKAAKPKKVKAKKPPKPKKEKKPKEKDNTPPLPKGPVIAIVVMVGSLFGLVLLGTNLLGYQTNISRAKELYRQEAYVDAYQELSGLEIKEKDMDLYNKLATLAPVSAEYNTYLIFSHSGRDDMALDALVCAYGRYNLNMENAKEYECVAEMEILGGKIIKALLEDYDMTGEEALSLYGQRPRRDYTVEMHKQLKKLGLE